MANKKKIDKKFKKKKKAIIIFIFLLVIGLFFIVAFKTTLFNITSIEVNGNKKLSKDKVIKASGNPIKENIFRIKLSTIENSLKMHPYVKEVKVKRKFPNKLMYEIKERDEKFVAFYAGSYVYLDETGHVLKIENDMNENNFPVIKNVNISKPDVGSKITGENMDLIEEILKFMEISDKIKLIEQIDMVDFSDRYNISIYLKDSIVVAFGPLNNVEYKLSYINEILKDIAKKDKVCKYIYFNRGENPVVVIDNN